MKKQIVINASKDRSRIAIVENDELVELYVENPDNVRTIGNVYLGRVQKVMPAIRAAFVDVGQKQDCFLHFSDLTDNLPQLLALAGEDVPGLNEPVLSLAPAKRVADDENEPDVEDALEVEAAEPESSTKSRSRRRSRGRGRSRRGRGRREEEEEQEEGRRRLPGVIDLSSPSQRSTRRRTPEPEPEPEEDPADERADDAVASTEETSVEETPVEETKPKRSRKKKKAEPADETPEAEPAPEAAADAEATEDSTDSDDADSDDTTSKKKRRRRRRRGGRGQGDDAAEEVGEAEPTDDAPSRSRTKKSDAASDAPDADASETAAKAPRSRKKKDADAPEKESKPSRSRKKEGETQGEGSRPGDVSPTGRSRRPENPADLDDSTATAGGGASAAEGEATSEDAGSSKRLPATLDLTSSSPSSRRGSDMSEGDDDEASGRSRRRSRSGRSSDASSDGPAEDSASSDADESDDRPSGGRSRRGRRSSSDDAEGQSRRSRSSSDDNETKDSEDDDGARGRRSRGRRSSESEEGADEGAEDTKGGDRRGRSGRSSDRSSRSGRSNGGAKGGAQKNGPIPPNEELLRRSGKIIVKITKEAISTKGPRVSTDLSLAGRFLVLVPAADYVAVSKKIESAKERRRLRTLATSLKPDRFGVIVRTVAEGRDAKSLDTDLRLLVEKWRKIEQKLNENPEPPVLLYQDVNMVSSVIRDLFSEDYDRILVDDPKVFKNVQAYVKAVAPQMADKVELHAGRSPVFRSLGIEKQVEEAFSKRVNMRGGGYLFIETTEAMHVVDVNSGRAGRGKSQKQNLIDVNVEAAREVAKQLRLRDLGGIIVVDFIDLKYDRDRKKVTDVLKQEFAKDRAVTKLLPMSDFGLVQITRQRLRPSITANAIDEDGNPLDAAEAAEAAGAGEIRRHGQTAAPEPEPAPVASEPVAERPALSPEEASPRALSGRLRGWLDHYRQTVDEKYKRRPIVVRVHPLFGGYLRRGFPSPLTRWRLSLRGITFVLEEDATVDPLTFDVRDQKSGRTLLKKYTP